MHYGVIFDDQGEIAGLGLGQTRAQAVALTRADALERQATRQGGPLGAVRDWVEARPVLPTTQRFYELAIEAPRRVIHYATLPDGRIDLAPPPRPVIPHR